MANGIWEKIKAFWSMPLLTINQTPVTIASILIFILIISGFVLLSRVLKNKILKGLLSRLHLDPGLQYTLLRITQYIVVFIGLVIALQFIGISLSGLAVILGFLSVGIGFGLQNVTSNFVAGLILLFERPIKVGDRVSVGDTEGDVTTINIRSTTIQTLNNISIIVPNGQFISQPVINWSHVDKKIRINVNVGVAYASDLDKVLMALREVAEQNPEVLKDPAPDVLFREFGESSWNMQLRCWIAEPTRHIPIQSDLHCAIVRIFRREGIEIPFPQRDIHVRSAVPLEQKKAGS
jgi:small-conductance mechanosensitive channel